MITYCTKQDRKALLCHIGPGHVNNCAHSESYERKEQEENVARRHHGFHHSCLFPSSSESRVAHAQWCSLQLRDVAFAVCSRRSALPCKRNPLRKSAISIAHGVFLPSEPLIRTSMSCNKHGRHQTAEVDSRFTPSFSSRLRRPSLSLYHLRVCAGNTAQKTVLPRASTDMSVLHGRSRGADVSISF